MINEFNNRRGTEYSAHNNDDNLRKIKMYLDKLSSLEQAEITEAFDYRDKEFLNNLSERKKAQSRDLVIWKYYSKIGGIHDILKDFEQAVKKPSVNAFDYDEDENTYIIFITLNNTLLARLKKLCLNMNNELDLVTDEEFAKKGEALIEAFEKLQKSKDEISRKKIKWSYSFQRYREDYSQLISKNSAVTSKTKQFLSNKTHFSGIVDALTGGQTNSDTNAVQQKEVLLKKILRTLNEIKTETDKYMTDMDNYSKMVDIFKEEQELLLSYRPKYSSLYELIKRLTVSVGEGEELYPLTVAPSREEGIDGYVEKAKIFCEKALEITAGYPL